MAAPSAAADDVSKTSSIQRRAIVAAPESSKTVTTSNSAATELNARVHSLPQELLDWIKEILIASDLPATIDKTWEPPIGLQLDHETRDKFAKEYFESIGGKIELSCFYHVSAKSGPHWTMLDDLDEAHDIMIPWIRDLHPSHRLLIGTVRFVVASAGRALDEYDTREELRAELEGECEYAWGKMFSLLPRGVLAPWVGNVVQQDGTLKNEEFRDEAEDD